MTEQPETASPGPSPNDRLDLTGTILAGRYRIVRRLGQGGMGSVWVGEHLRMGRLDAIKVLRGGLAEDADSLARFNRGARNLSAIRHPNVCTLYDYGETEDGSPFLAIELIHGESLKELLDREGPLDAVRAVAIARQISSALQAAHDAGIVHRDLKPANVMIERGSDGSDVAKVVDFDIAKGPEAQSGEEVTRLGFVVGTPEYMSPEQLMGDALDGRSDIYSLGLVLFRMLTGELPFRGGSTHEVMVQRLTTAPLRIEEVSSVTRVIPGLQDTLDRALAVQREGRYARAAEFTADLDRLLAGTAPAAAAPAPRPAPAPAYAGAAVPETVFSAPAQAPVAAPAKRKSSAAFWLVGAAVIVIGGGAAAWMAFGSRSGVPETEPGSSAPITIAADSDRVEEPPAGTRVEPQTAGGSRPVAQPNPPVTDPVRPPPSQPAEERPAISINASDVQSTLERLMERIWDWEETLSGAAAGDTRLASRVAAGSAAVRDTASAIFAQSNASQDDRAFAAYITAYAHHLLKDGGECERWVDRALGLKPDAKSYPELRTRCRSFQP